jgi:transcriptional regulator with XRE-family HTH domain
MGIKDRILREYELRNSLTRSKGKINFKDMAKSIGVSYTGLLRWKNNKDRSISDATLDKIADYMGKEVVLIDKEI